MYLTDKDLINMLSRCGNNLKGSGLIVIKENVFDVENDIGHFKVDQDDNSVIRSPAHFE